MSSFRQMEYFLEVAEAGSIRQAALRLGVTQPTLSVQLRALEDALGVILFERSRASTRLSPAGRELLPEVQNLVSQWRNVIERAHLIGDHSHLTYRLGVPPTLGPYLLPTLLPSIHRTFAKLRLHVREEVPDLLLQGLEAGRFDLVIGPFAEQSTSMVRTSLFREPLLLAMAPETGVAMGDDLSESDLSGLDVLAIDERHALRREVERICEQTGARLNRNYEGTSLDTLRQMVVMGMGLAFLPALYVRSEIHRPEELKILALSGGRLFREHALLYRANSPSRGFYRELTEVIQIVINDELIDTVTPIH